MPGVKIASRAGDSILTPAAMQPRLTTIQATPRCMRPPRGRISGEKGVRRARSKPRHDLRRNATTRLAEAGCNVFDISSITGLSPSMIQKQIYNARPKAHLQRHEASGAQSLNERLFRIEIQRRQ
jgi:hypothetical protein